MDYKAGMFVYALAFLLGIVCVQQLAVLPDTFSCIFLLFLVTGLCLLLAFTVNLQGYIFKQYLTLVITVILLILIGYSYAIFFAKKQLNYQLDDSFIGQSIVINGLVSSIPVSSGKVQRFEIAVDRYRVLSSSAQTDKAPAFKFPQKLRLSWYYGSQLNAGEKWQLEVRLKPPHGFMNPGGFDYEAWLFQHGIDATGYVRKSDLNLKQQSASWWSINSIRQFIGQQIDAIADAKYNSDENNALALLKALAIGDKSSISSQQWRVLTQTGTSHLMAISGLHIGLASLFAYALIRRIVPVYVMQSLPAQHVALIGGMLMALLYALVAGLSIPTQRAVIMLFALSIMMLIRRNNRPLDSLGFALLLVLLVDPIAILSAGFWFSFSAVAVIFISVMTEQKAEADKISWWKKTRIMLKQWVRLQLIISVFLLPLSLYMFQQVSLISPLANLVLIPYVSFLVVPVVLLALILSYLFQDIAALLFKLAALLLDSIWPVLAYLSELPFALWVRGDVDVIELLLASIAMLLIFFAPKLSQYAVPCLSNHNKHKLIAVSWLFRFVVSLLFIPLFIANNAAAKTGDYKLSILDVGQGSAAVIQTPNHVLVFDSGAKFSERLDAGSGVVVPYLRSENVTMIDFLIISHGDMDHIGGAQAILNAYPETFLIGQDLDQLKVKNEQPGNKQPCVAGMQWHWDGVDFEFLSPVADAAISASKKRNNHSCVLHISSPAGSVLFTGDIEKNVEQQLLEKYGKQLSADILIVPHHGSKTSSSTAFIASVDPKISIISAGYMNRYRLPASQVIARYQAAQREVIQTENSGAIIISLYAEQGIVVERYREMAQKYWNYSSY